MTGDMPNLLHDPEAYASIRKRIQSLRVDARRQWGTMSIDQMLWHVNVSMREAVGEYTAQLKPLPVPKAVFALRGHQHSLGTRCAHPARHVRRVDLRFQRPEGRVPVPDRPHRGPAAIRRVAG